jgi:carbon-monoxide dehydrogenase medium subunit
MQQNSDAKLLAGGHSLIPALKLRLASPGTLIDIGRIGELKGIARHNGAAIIGALTTHAMIAASSELPHALSEAAGWIGDPSVRNRGTIGGNVAHADPASDLPTVLVALDATFHLRGPNGTRSVSADDFFVDLFATALSEDEILTSIDVPVDGAGSAYAKLFNPASRYAIVGAAAKIVMNGSSCSSARVAIGGCTPNAKRLPSVEAALVGRTLNDATIEAAANLAGNDLGDDLMGDLHASDAYRRAVAPTYVQNAIAKAVERA